MILISPGARVWIATGHTDMRKGMQGLSDIHTQSEILPSRSRKASEWSLSISASVNGLSDSGNSTILIMPAPARAQAGSRPG
jgi:hypothetical protein